MNNTVHASFSSKGDGVQAVRALIALGIKGENISLILPDEHDEKHSGAGEHPHVVPISTGSHPVHAHKAHAAHPEVPILPKLPALPPRSAPHYYDEDHIMAPGATGYTYDSLGAVIPDSPGRKRRQSSRRKGDGYTVIDTEEGVGLGLGLGLLTALCIPGIGMFAGTAAIVASCIAGGAAVGGVGGGIYGFLTDRGAADNTARKMSDQVNAGGAALSVTLSNTGKKAEVIQIIKGLNGRIIEHSHQD